MSSCRYCGKGLSPKAKGDCCLKCYKKPLAEERYIEWLATGDLGIAVGTTLRGHLRTLIQEHYGNECNICGMKPMWRGKELVLILDHIDGDASNNVESNLRFVCPNCDSQLSTYKSKNRNSARSHRSKY